MKKSHKVKSLNPYSKIKVITQEYLKNYSQYNPSSLYKEPSHKFFAFGKEHSYGNTIFDIGANLIKDYYERELSEDNYI